MSVQQALPDFFKGRGAQVNSHNPFLKHQYVQEHFEGLDEPMLENTVTEYFSEYPRKIVNKVTSPDLPMDWSMNPYQGCEHGCIYCYARPTHEYLGFSAGLDFESRIMVKEDAPQRLRDELSASRWKPQVIALSSATLADRNSSSLALPARRSSSTKAGSTAPSTSSTNAPSCSV